MYNNSPGYWALLLIAAGEAAGMVLAARVLLHYFQLESYQFRGYFKTILRQWLPAFLPGVLLEIVPVVSFSVAVALFIPLVLITNSFEVTFTLLVVPFVVSPVILGLVLHFKAKETPQEKKFALTARMKRLYVALALVCLATVGLNWWGVLACDDLERVNEAYGALGLILYIRPGLFLPLLVALAAIIAVPFERLFFRKVSYDAER